MSWLDFTGLSTYHTKIKEFIENKLSKKLDVGANAVSASKLHTPVKINGVSFDGSQDITIKSLKKESSYIVEIQPNTNTAKIPIETELTENDIVYLYLDGIKLIKDMHFNIEYKSKQITILHTYSYKTVAEIIIIKE